MGWGRFDKRMGVRSGMGDACCWWKEGTDVVERGNSTCLKFAQDSWFLVTTAKNRRIKLLKYIFE